MAAALVLLAAAPAAGPAGAHDPSGVLFVEAHDDGASGWFEVLTPERGYDEPNPTVVLRPNTTYDVRFRNHPDSTADHVLRVGSPVEASAGPVEPGNATDLNVTVGATIPEAYWDPGWRDAGMEGAFALDVHDEGANEQALPAGAGAAALLAAALVGSRRRR